MSEALDLEQFNHLPNSPIKVGNIVKRIIREDSRFRRKFTNINGMVSFHVQIEEGQEINAYAYKTGGQEYLAFTRACLQNLDEKEFEAIVGHEMAHHLKSDYTYAGAYALMLFCLLLSGTIYFSFMVGFVLNSYLSIFIGKMAFGSLVGFILFLSGGTITTYITARVYWHFFQQIEYRADKISAEIFGTEAMASALRKLSSPNRKITRLEEFLSQFATHPPIEDRIKRLEEMDLTE